jgi:hypothetical protein
MGWDFARLNTLVSKEFALPEGCLLRRGRTNNRSIAQKIFAYLGYVVLGYLVIEIARYFSVSGPAVSQSLGEGELLAKARNINKVT